jgi:uncharacterized protein
LSPSRTFFHAAELMRSGTRPRRSPAAARRRGWWLLALPLAVTSLSVASGDPPRPRFPRGEPLLWRVEQGGAVSHLFGTCHLPLDLEKALGPAGVDALDHSRRIFVEIDGSSLMTALDAFKIFGSRAQMPDRSLKALLPPAAWQRLVALHEGRLDVETLDHIKPWAATLATFMRLRERTRAYQKQRAGLDVRRPVLDTAIAMRAKEHEVRVEALESPLVHVQIFNSQRFEDDVRTLADLLENPEASPESFAILDACVAFDERTLRKETGRLERRHPRLADRMLRQRNLAWVERLTLWLPDGDMFVAVGTAHMFGDDGLVALLRNRGYRVSRVRTADAAR